MPGLRLVEGPETEPLELDELKEHLRMTETTPEQDRDLGRKLTAARRWVEARTGLALLPQTWEYWFDAFPGYYGVPYAAYLDIPKAPLISVDAVSSYDEDNVATVFDDAGYVVDVVRGRVLLNADTSWPSDVRRHQAGLIEFTAGFADIDSIPPDVVQAVAEYAGYLWDGDPEALARAEELVARHELVTA